jgi:hypothetical protein
VTAELTFAFEIDTFLPLQRVFLLLQLVFVAGNFDLEVCGAGRMDKFLQSLVHRR